MKWFFAFRQGNDFSAAYIELLKVAVTSALQNTTLEPWFVYDGEPDSLVSWMEERGVRVVYHRSFLYPHLEQIARKKGDINYLVIGSGAFLRVEIPLITARLGLQDEFVLYTDIDVLFLEDVVPELEKLRPGYFAVSPEAEKDDFRNVNTGVMLMNLPALRRAHAGFEKFIIRKLDKLVRISWDQGAYKLYFRKGVFRRPLWDPLPIRFNWKPYWEDDGQNPKIIHFHGPKPQHRALYALPDAQRRLGCLYGFMNEQYWSRCREWDRYHEAISGRPETSSSGQ